MQSIACAASLLMGRCGKGRDGFPRATRAREACLLCRYFWLACGDLFSSPNEIATVVVAALVVVFKLDGIVLNVHGAAKFFGLAPSPQLRIDILVFERLLFQSYVRVSLACAPTKALLLPEMWIRKAVDALRDEYPFGENADNVMSQRDSIAQLTLRVLELCYMSPHPLVLHPKECTVACLFTSVALHRCHVMLSQIRGISKALDAAFEVALFFLFTSIPEVVTSALGGDRSGLCVPQAIQTYVEAPRGDLPSCEGIDQHAASFFRYAANEVTIAALIARHQVVAKEEEAPAAAPRCESK